MSQTPTADQLDLLGYVAPAAVEREPEATVARPTDPVLLATEPGRPRLLIVDGNNLVHRFNHSPSREYEPHEQFGHMLTRLRGVVRPQYAVVVFDSDEPTWRHDLYPGYKARPGDRPELGGLFDLCQRECEAMRLRWVREDGAEADDLIATYTAAASVRGWATTIVTGDKDMMQLVTDEPAPVRVLTTLGKWLTWGPPEVLAKFQVPPERFPDLLALAGDPSDAYPGVPKIGTVRAAQLVRDHGDLERIIDRLELVKWPAIRESLRAHVEQARLCKTLATLRCDLCLPMGLDSLRWT